MCREVDQPSLDVSMTFNSKIPSPLGGVFKRRSGHERAWVPPLTAHRGDCLQDRFGKLSTKYGDQSRPDRGNPRDYTILGTNTA